MHRLISPKLSIIDKRKKRKEKGALAKAYAALTTTDKRKNSRERGRCYNISCPGYY